MITPQNAQHHTELSILGYLMSRGDEPALIQKVFLVCKPENFMHSETRPVAEAMLSLVERGEQADLTGIASEMKSKATLAKIGGAGTLAGILEEFKNAILSEARLLQSVDELIVEHAKREAQQGISSALRDLQNPNADASEVAESLRGIASTLEGERRTHALPFKPLSGDDLLSLPRPMWRVKNVFPKCGTAVVYGPSRAGKTFAVLDLVLSMARGEEWFGWRTADCEILYICLESVWGLQGRVKAWALDKGQPIPGNLRFIIDAFNLGDRQHVKAISAIAPKGGVLVIDTLNRAAPGVDENSSKDMSLIIKAADDISKAMEGLVILVSHSGKDAAKGLRGHSSLFAALDTSIEIGRNGDTRLIKIDKVKESEDGAKKFFRLKPVVIGLDEEGEDITSCVVESLDADQAGKGDDRPLTKSQEYALETLVNALRHEGTSTVKLEAWRKYFYEGHTADNEDAKRQAFLRARSGLVEKQKIHVINDSYGVTMRDNRVTLQLLSRANTRDGFA